jgi:uncharacterized protein (TIGR03643 family)
MKIKDTKNIDRIIEMAWEDRTPFDAIFAQFEVPEKEVIRIMRKKLKRKSFKNWRERVTGRKTKHAKNKLSGVRRFRSKNQK